MRNMAVLHSPAFSYPLPVLVRVLFNLLIFKGKILYYNKYRENNRIVHVHRRKKWPLSSCLYSHTEQEEYGLDLTYFSNVMMKHRDGQM